MGLRLFLLFICISNCLSVNPCFSQADSNAILRAKYWAERGHKFDASYMSAYAMDRKVEDLDRAKYWAERGYNFDASYMTAYAMDRKVEDLERAKYWAERGYAFDASYMTAYAMDRKVEEIEQEIPEKNFIRILQLSLKFLGYKPGPIDGVLGPRTVAAIQLFNRDNFHEASHYPDQKSRDLLAARLRSFPKNSAAANWLNENSITTDALTSYLLDYKGRLVPKVAENGSYYGEVSEKTGRPTVVHVRGYYRKDGTYVRGHYRSRPRR